MKRAFPRSVAVAALLLGALLLAARFIFAHPHNSTEVCEQLYLHYVDAKLRHDDPTLSADNLDGARRDLLAQAREQGSIHACEVQVPAEDISCAMSTGDPDAIERCLVPIP